MFMCPDPSIGFISVGWWYQRLRGDEKWLQYGVNSVLTMIVPSLTKRLTQKATGWINGAVSRCSAALPRICCCQSHRQAIKTIGQSVFADCQMQQKKQLPRQIWWEQALLKVVWSFKQLIPTKGLCAYNTSPMHPTVSRPENAERQW